MSKVKKSTNPFYIESNQAFRQVFLVNLNKLSDSSTKKTGLDEIRDLLINQVQDTDRISLVLNLVSENSDHQKSTGKREVMRIIGLMAEVFEDKLASFVPKIISIVSKKLQENDPQIHDTLSASVGNLVSFTLRNLELETAYRDLQSLLTMLVQLCSKSNRYTQVGAAVCIAKVIQSSPFEFLYLMVDDLTLRIVELTRLHVCKAHVQLFECLISLVLAFEGNGEKLAKSATTMLPLAIENLTNSDWNIRKIAVEVIYTLSVLVPEAITPYKHALLDVLGHCRFDKIKNVRDVSLTAIARLKELEDPQNPAQISQLQSNEVPQYQTASFKQADTGHGHSASLHRPDEEMGQSKWTSSTVRDPQNGSRPGLKVNPEFFNNAPKHKGDIEIFTKTPPREFIVENNSAAIKKNPVVQEGDPSVQIEESPNKTYKYTVSAKKSPRSEENMFSNRQNVTSEFKPEGQIEEETNKRTSFPPNNMDLPSPPRAKRSPREQTEAKMRAFQNSPGQPDKMEQEERRREKPRFSDDDFSNVFKQLDHITKQQEKMMESMNNFQNTTLNELKQLKARVKDVEDHIYKSQHTQKAPPAYPYQPPPYGYAPPPYQPLIQPQPQAPYPMSYSNYAPAYFYPPGPGMGPNPGRPVDPNWMRRPQGEYPPNQSFQGRQSMAQPSRDRERYERGSPNQNRNDGDRIQPELNRVQNRGDPNKESKGHDDFQREHTKKPSKAKMEDRGSKNSIWERLQDLLSRSQVNAAFELCLTEGDEETLIALMKETGVIVEYLENPIVENILTGLKSRVFDEAHRDLMLNWIEKSVTTDAGVSRGTFIALHDILMQLLEEGTGLNHASTEKVKKVRREIQQLLDNQPEESELKNIAPKEDDEMENEITDEREGTEGNEIK